MCLTQFDFATLLDRRFSRALFVGLAASLSCSMAWAAKNWMPLIAPVPDQGEAGTLGTTSSTLAKSVSLYVTLPSVVLRSRPIEASKPSQSAAPPSSGLGAADSGLVLARYRSLKSNAPDLTVRARADGYSLDTVSPMAASDWEKLGQDAAYEIELADNSMALSFRMKRGQVRLSEVSGAVTGSCVSCSVDIASASAAVSLSVLTGEVKLQKTSGALDVQLQAAKLSLKDHVGPYSVSSLSGDVSGSNLKGNARVAVNSGALQLSGLEGSVNLVSARSAVSLSGLNGRLRGSAQDGQVQVDLKGLTDVNFESGDAAFVVAVPAGQGASLRLQSEEGSIIVPEPLKAPKGTGPKSFSGRLPGEAKGSLVIRSKKGSVRVKS